HLLEGEAIPRKHLALGLVALMYGGLTLSRALRGTALSDEVIKACRAAGRLLLHCERTEEGKTKKPTNSVYEPPPRTGTFASCSGPSRAMSLRRPSQSSSVSVSSRSSSAAP